jgi:hypothetical protein
MSCHNATANQVRLVLHTAAFWLMHGVRAAIRQTSSLAKAEFATIRERLIYLIEEPGGLFHKSRRLTERAHTQ